MTETQLGPTHAIEGARRTLDAARDAATRDPTPANLDAWTAALNRLHVVKAQADEARLMAGRHREDPERWDGMS